MASLQTQLRSVRQDSTRLRLYVQLADTLYAQENFDSLFAITQQAIPLAIARQEPKYEARLYYRLSMVYRHQRALSKTLETLEKTVSVSRRAKDVQTEAWAMYVIPTVYNDQGNHKKAIAQSLTNLDYFKKQHLSQLELYTYDLLSYIYKDLADTQQYKYYLEKTVQMMDLIKTPNERILIYSNMAQLYEDEGNYEKAWPYRQKAVVTAKALSSKKMTQIHNLILAATNLRERHQLKEAMYHLQDAIEVSKEIPPFNVVKGGHIYIEMARVLLEMGNYRQALRLAQIYVAGAKSLYLAKDIMIGLETLYLVQEKSGQYQDALNTFKEYHTIMDSLRTVEKSAQVAKVQASYELEKKDNTIQSLKEQAQLDYLRTKEQDQKLELAHRQRSLYIISTSLLTCLVGVVGYFLRRLFKAQQLLARKKQEIETQARQLQETNRFKDHLFAIVSHDLRSPVASLKASFTLLKIRNRYSPELTGLEQEVNGLSQTLDNILYWSLNQQNGLLLRQQRLSLKDMVEDALEGFAGFICQKQLIVTFDALLVSVWTDENMTMLVLRNILHNAIKFTAPGGAVRVSITTEPHQTSLRIVDTGIGMDLTNASQPTKQHGTGLGLNLSKGMMQQIGGRLILESQPGCGTSVTLSWPNIDAA